VALRGASDTMAESPNHPPGPTTLIVAVSPSGVVTRPRTGQPPRDGARGQDALVEYDVAAGELPACVFCWSNAWLSSRAARRALPLHRAQHHTCPLLSERRVAADHRPPVE